MQSRPSPSTSSTLLPSTAPSASLSVEENGILLGLNTHHNQNINHITARDWPVKLFKLLFAFILLGAGLILGVVFTLHVSHYVAPTSYNSMGTLYKTASQMADDENNIRGLSGPSLPHNISDSELLWLASMVPQRKEMPITRVPKVAFMFLTRGPLPLAPFWERFFKGNEGLFSVYVHTDPSFKLDVPRSSVFYQRQIPSQVCHL